jgi:hypothetical protein
MRRCESTLSSRLPPVAAAWPAQRNLDRPRDELSERGIEVVAISGEARDGSEQLHADWKLERVPIACGLTDPPMRECGLFGSRRRTAVLFEPLPTLSSRFIYLDRVGGAGEHQERATGGMRKLVGGASVDQVSDRAIAARAYDQQIERCAVQR